MDRIEAIQARTSVRAYSSMEISDADLEPIMMAMDIFNKESGLTMEFMKDGSAAFDGITKSYGMFKDVRGLIVLKGPSDDIDLDEKAGYFGELLVLEATVVGLGTCFVAGTYDPSAISIKDGERLVCVVTVGYPKEKRPFREKLIKKFTSSKASVETHLTSSGECPQWVSDGVDAALRAPSAMNRKPVKFRYDNDELTIYVDGEGGYNMIDLGIAKANFVTAVKGAFHTGNNASFVRSH